MAAQHGIGARCGGQRRCQESGPAAGGPVLAQPGRHHRRLLRRVCDQRRDRRAARRQRRQMAAAQAGDAAGTTEGIGDQGKQAPPRQRRRPAGLEGQGRRY
ncbi:MAG: hypothetical protein OHK0024_13910 [Thalassobaculales bacterium]